MGAITGMLGVGGQAGGTGFGGPAMPDQTGMNNLQNSYQQLQQVASGQGPNPAMAQYNQNIQSLAGQQAGAISSIQGISPALAARMASQQGSSAMQNAAAQGATMQAQQQLGAMGQMGNIAGMQAGAANQMQGNINNVNAGLAQQTMQNQMGFIGGLFGGASGALSPKSGAVPKAEGGMIEAPSRQIQGGGMDISAPISQPSTGDVTQSLLSKFLSGDIAYRDKPVGGPQALQTGMTKFGTALGDRNGWNAANGGVARDFRSGGGVRAENQAQKAVKAGNSYANDKIPAVLSEGEVVIPRDVMLSTNPVKASADFVANVIAKRRVRK